MLDRLFATKSDLERITDEKPPELAKAEHDLEQARDLREKLRAESSVLRVQYMRKPSADLERQIRDFDAQIPTVEDRIRAARRVRADLMPAYAAQVSTVIEQPVAEAAARVLAVLPELRDAVGTIADAGALPGQTRIAMALSTVNLATLAQLESLAASLLERSEK